MMRQGMLCLIEKFGPRREPDTVSFLEYMDVAVSMQSKLSFENNQHLITAKNFSVEVLLELHA